MAVTAQEMRLDYFRIYDIENCAAKGSILTKGQFDKTAEEGRLQVLDYFGVCTAKNKEPLYNKYAHLTWYRLLQEASEPTRTVAVRNQFGDATLWIGKVEALLCPAQKLEKGSEFPGGLDHFKVYRVLDYGKPPKIGVNLNDQFGAEKVQVDIPIYFAVPVLKTAGKKEYPVVNPKAHLVIYQTPPKSLKKSTSARDQFGKEWPVQLIRGVALAVPSIKRSWK